MNEFIYAENDSLCLRKATACDRDALFALLSDSDVNTFLPWFPLSSMKETEVFLQEHFFAEYEAKRGFHSLICLRESNQVIGYVHMSGDESHDFGYAIAKAYWHQGIASSAGQLALAYLKDQGVSYITATHDVKNSNSGKVMEKLGMKYCYTYEEQWMPKNKNVHFRMYQLNFDGEERVYQVYRNKYNAWEERITNE